MKKVVEVEEVERKMCDEVTMKLFKNQNNIFGNMANVIRAEKLHFMNSAKKLLRIFSCSVFRIVGQYFWTNFLSEVRK